MLQVLSHFHIITVDSFQLNSYPVGIEPELFLCCSKLLLPSSSSVQMTNLFLSLYLFFFPYIYKPVPAYTLLHCIIFFWLQNGTWEGPWLHKGFNCYGAGSTARRALRRGDRSFRACYFQCNLRLFIGILSITILLQGFLLNGLWLSHNFKRAAVISSHLL